MNAEVKALVEASAAVTARWKRLYPSDGQTRPIADRELAVAIQDLAAALEALSAPPSNTEFDLSDPLNAAIGNLATGSPERELAIGIWIAALNWVEAGRFPYAVSWPSLSTPKASEPGVEDPTEQPGFDYFECPECGFDSVQTADFTGRETCPMCESDSGHDVRMSRRTARTTDKPEGKDARRANPPAGEV